MRKLYIIQFKNPANSSIINRVKSLGDWIKYLPESWLVESDLTAKDIYNKITGEEEIRVFISEFSMNYYGRMNTKLWDFIKARKKKK